MGRNEKMRRPSQVEGSRCKGTRGVGCQMEGPVSLQSLLRAELQERFPTNPMTRHDE